MAGEIAMTFLPSLAYLATALFIVACARWTPRRKRQPGYAPLWAIALVLAIAVAFTAIGLARMALGYEPGVRYAATHAAPKPRRFTAAVKVVHARLRRPVPGPAVVRSGAFAGRGNAE